ncbi:Uu.00g133470.m01.CDS01 [Anthostomella pinea]|uniref:Uu.00g133470.m01.CDS01 n=1 Tax=Anthostomella pinea TaxID=933095 RepID=A0AAI8VPP8_9PEZI|nr:Uu.00g133470.m01.CDS01 [Anthostomella pinea]
MTHNHANYQRRLDFVHGLLREQFDLEVNAEVIPIQYDPECPFKYNNFVYRVILPVPVTSAHSFRHEARRHGCDPIPHGTKELIIRLTNVDAEGMSPATRVENEVAMISLAAAALSGFRPSVVPSVYAWGSAATTAAQGWIIQQLMPGEAVDEAFTSMHLAGKKSILSQMASLLKALQDYQLPETITGFGGVTFDEDGRIVSTAMTSVGAGPWPSYESSFRGRLQVALQRADENPYIEGWHANGIRERLDAFVAHGVPSQFESFKTANDKAIIHADFTTNNLLFDSSTQRITALLDYDFTCIMHPSYEFLRSFDGAGGQFRGWSADEAGEQAVLRNAKLHGFPSPLPQPTNDGVDWELAKAWEDELERLHVNRPATMEGIDKAADVDTVLRTVLPWRVSNSDILRMQSKEVIMKCKEKNETQLVQLLERLGF